MDGSFSLTRSTFISLALCLAALACGRDGPLGPRFDPTDPATGTYVLTSLGNKELPVVVDTYDNGDGEITMRLESSSMQVVETEDVPDPETYDGTWTETLVHSFTVNGEKTMGDPEITNGYFSRGTTFHFERFDGPPVYNGSYDGHEFVLTESAGSEAYRFERQP